MRDDERNNYTGVSPSIPIYVQQKYCVYGTHELLGYLVMWEVGIKSFTKSERYKIYRKLSGELLRISLEGGRMQKIQRNTLLVDNLQNALRIAKLLKSLNVKARIYKVLEEVEVE